MNRRGFLAALVAAPIAAKLPPAQGPLSATKIIYGDGSPPPVAFVGLSPRPLPAGLEFIVTESSIYRTVIRTGLPTPTWRKLYG